MRENWRKASKKVYNLLVLFLSKCFFGVCMRASYDKITLWAVLACVVFALQSKKTKDTKKLLQNAFLLGVGKECFSVKRFVCLIWECFCNLAKNAYRWAIESTK